MLVSEQLQKVRLIRLSIQIKLLEELSRGALLHILLFLLLMQVLLQLCIFKILASLPEGFLQLLELLCASPRLVRVFLQSGATEHLHHVLHPRVDIELLEAQDPESSRNLWIFLENHFVVFTGGWLQPTDWLVTVSKVLGGNFSVKVTPWSGVRDQVRQAGSGIT